MKAERTADEWFALGERIPYDPHTGRILSPGDPTNPPEALRVFRRVVRNAAPNDEDIWTTFLPGFPDGSFGWARVDRLVASDRLMPRLFVEYVGQGDSDKPTDYAYGTTERADLVEAHWQAQGIQSTFLVTFDYSSLVALELLSRQEDLRSRGSELPTRIEKVLMINGGLFADAHSHPWLTTPILKSPMGKMGTWMAQRSKLVFNQMVKVLWSKEYDVSSDELEEMYRAISRRGGVAFLSKAAGFVDEHKANGDRWDLLRVFLAARDATSFHIVGSKGDPFEPKQIASARERLGPYGLDIRVLPGGHLTTSEQPELLAQILEELGPKP